MNPPDHNTQDTPDTSAQPPDAGKADGERTGATPEQPAVQTEPPPARTLRQRLIGGVSWKGWLRLAVLCLLVGAVFEAGGINLFAPDFTPAGALGAIGKGVVNILSWIVTVGWRPLVTGALIVLPLWLLWRLASAPFRKQG